MLPYWILFLIPAGFAASRIRTGAVPDKRWPTLWWAMFVLLVLAIGLRHEVGADWFTYLEHINEAGDQPSLLDMLSARGTRGDPAYDALNWLAAQTDLGPYFVNTACAAAFAWGLVEFCRSQPRPWLAMVVAVPYLVTVVAMGYTRQGVAIGLTMLALVALSEHKLLRFFVFIAVAATFHKSAVILMPLAVLAGTSNRIWRAIWVAVASLVLYGLFLQDSVENLKANYIDAEYESSGAAIRVAMNAVPALLFLVFRRRFVMAPADRSFWTWMAVGAIGLVWLLWESPSSTAVDRLALYWIPLQLFVLSRLPNALGPPHGRNDVWVCLIVAYSAAVLVVWLFFADHAYAWVPYQFYPWVVLWQ